MRSDDSAFHVDEEGIVHTAIRWPGGWMTDCLREVVRVVQRDEVKLTCAMCIGLIGTRD